MSFVRNIPSTQLATRTPDLPHPATQGATIDISTVRDGDIVEVGSIPRQPSSTELTVIPQGVVVPGAIPTRLPEGLELFTRSDGSVVIVPTRPQPLPLENGAPEVPSGRNSSSSPDNQPLTGPLDRLPDSVGTSGASRNPLALNAGRAVVGGAGLTAAGLLVPQLLGGGSDDNPASIIPGQQTPQSLFGSTGGESAGTNGRSGLALPGGPTDFLTESTPAPTPTPLANLDGVTSGAVGFDPNSQSLDALLAAVEQSERLKEQAFKLAGWDNEKN